MVITDIYQDLTAFYRKRDHALIHLPLAGAPWQPFLLLIAYAYLALHWGPRLMRNRPAYGLRKIMLVYNAGQVAANLFMAGWAIRHAVNNISDMHCLPTNADNTLATYVYYMNKCVDLLETLIFVLRKKTDQVSFLHVYHHIMVILCSYATLCIQPGGHILFYGFLNCLVHAAMYGYYFISIYDATLLQGNLWLTKKNVTRMQMSQFVLVIIHLTVPLTFGYCDYSSVLSYLGIFQCSLMLTLFTRFYLKAYCGEQYSKFK